MAFCCPYCGYVYQNQVVLPDIPITCASCQARFLPVTQPISPSPQPIIYQQISDNRTSAGMAALLSLLIPGLGQVVQGRPVPATIFFLFFLASAAASVFIVGIPFLIICWACAVLDAASN